MTPASRLAEAVREFFQGWDNKSAPVCATTPLRAALAGPKDGAR